MKLKYNKKFRYFPRNNGGTDKEFYFEPELELIDNFDKTKEIFDDLFIRNSYYRNLEFIDYGNKAIIRCDFWRGAFNEYPIKFSIESDSSKKFPKHSLINSIIGSISESYFYFLYIKDGDLKIDKMMEIM